MHIGEHVAIKEVNLESLEDKSLESLSVSNVGKIFIERNNNNEFLTT